MITEQIKIELQALACDIIENGETDPRGYVGHVMLPAARQHLEDYGNEEINTPFGSYHVAAVISHARRIAAEIKIDNR